VMGHHVTAISTLVLLMSITEFHHFSHMLTTFYVLWMVKFHSCMLFSVWQINIWKCIEHLYSTCLWWILFNKFIYEVHEWSWHLLYSYSKVLPFQRPQCCTASFSEWSSWAC
jgi:hypothetical protein